MTETADISNSVAIPVNINTVLVKPDKNSEELEKRIRQKYSQLTTKIENIDIVTSQPVLSSVVISEESLTGELPAEYGDTRIVIQARDPHWAWVYWEYSTIEQKKLEVELGAFEYAHTSLFLKVFNVTYDYSFEIDLPEKCDNWYLSLNDSNCEYYVQLCIRIPSVGVRILATSQIIKLPNDKVSENLAEWVPANLPEEIKVDEKVASEINNDNHEFDKKVSSQEDRLLSKINKINKISEVLGNEGLEDSNLVGSSDELYKKK
jgi:hypothetical protein